MDSTFKNFRLQRAHTICFNEENVRSWNKKVFTFFIFRRWGLISLLCVLIKKNVRSCNKSFLPSKWFLIKEMSDPGKKWFQPSKFFACGGLILCISQKFVFQMKETSDRGIKRFLPSKFYTATGSYKYHVLWLVIGRILGHGLAENDSFSRPRPNISNVIPRLGLG